MRLTTALALLFLVAAFGWFTDTGRAAIPPKAARPVVVSYGGYGLHGKGRGVARITSRSTIFQRRANVIRSVFGVHGADAVRVARCESGPLLDPRAKNGQYVGTFQLGYAERRRFGHGPGVRQQALAAWRYFRLAGWRPWACA